MTPNTSAAGGGVLYYDGQKAVDAVRNRGTSYNTAGRSTSSSLYITIPDPSGAHCYAITLQHDGQKAEDAVRDMGTSQHS